MKNVFISTTDECAREIIKCSVKKVFPQAQVIYDMNDTEALYHLKYDAGNAIFFDRLYMSYVLKFNIAALKTMNESNKIYFCESGDCSPYFGIRLYDLKVDGFMSNIERVDDFVKKLKVISTGRPYFQQEVFDYLENRHVRKNERKAITEVTDLEYQIGLLLGQGYQLKDISDRLHISLSAVGNHIHWLKKKIGYKCMNDFAILNKQMEKFNLRSCI
ncbi:hypothetical protein [Treponema bryantii]|uniref:helix-turn-helix transcriptional regulator n=1 Tax=Treponema bryantii TaxID=163 RepID=UPI002B30688B|nr:hypothetical protein TRBR_17150 [Treponema bryantii]